LCFKEIRIVSRELSSLSLKRCILRLQTWLLAWELLKSRITLRFVEMNWNEIESRDKETCRQNSRHVTRLDCETKINRTVHFLCDNFSHLKNKTIHCRAVHQERQENEVHCYLSTLLFIFLKKGLRCLHMQYVCKIKRSYREADP
jgi:hypothetical protein